MKRQKLFLFLMWGIFVLSGRLAALEKPPSSPELAKYFQGKYQAEVEVGQPVQLGENVFAVKFDFQKDWWGSFAVVETDENRHVKYTWDILEYPTENSISYLDAKRFRQFPRPLLLVAGRTHMGNGCLCVYRQYPGKLEIILRARVFARLGNLNFRETMARVRVFDQNGDGFDDLEISATLHDSETGKDHPYYRLFLGTSWGLPEKKEAARGLVYLSPYGY